MTKELKATSIAILAIETAEKNGFTLIPDGYEIDIDSSGCDNAEQAKTILKLHDLIASADMRSRLAFGEARSANEQMKKLVDKNKKDFEFLMNSPQQTDKFKNKKKWTGGIDV